MDDQELSHLAGVFDADGVIAIQIHRDEDYTLNHRIKPAVSLNRPQTDSQELLFGKFIEYCEEQMVQFSIIEDNQREGGRLRNQLLIRDHRSIEAFLKPLLPFLVANYESALLMIEHALPMFEDNRHLEKEGFYQLVQLAEEIRDNRDDRSKYTAEYFEERWSVA